MTTPEIKKNIAHLKNKILDNSTFEIKNLYLILPIVIILLLVFFTPNFLKIKNSNNKYKIFFYWILILLSSCFSIYIYIKK